MADSIKKLTELFRRFPTIGSRTAGRFVYYLINQPEATANELIAAIQELKNSVKLCANCFNPFESIAGSDLAICLICQSSARSKNLLCIVEKEADLLSIEKTGRYKGLYFILGSSARLPKLQEKVKVTNPTEIILALNPTPEGKTLSVLVERMLKENFKFQISNFKLKLTHLAQGLPVGGELEYADEETLESAFEGRK